MMNSVRSRFFKKLLSLSVLATGGACSFAAICIHKGNEKFYQDILMPAIHVLYDPEKAHSLAILAAKWGFVPKSKFEDENILGVTLWGMNFKNPIGIAAGFDKNGEAVTGLFKTGAGFVEVGTVTPLPQDGNPKPRIFRLKEDEAVINRCGFNSKGHSYVKSCLHCDKKLTNRQGILGINLGKNKLSDSAVSDYVQGVQEFSGIADYMVINVSSPNTPGLRSLQKREALEELLSKVAEARKSYCMEIKSKENKHNNMQKNQVCYPILVKIAPDLSYQDKLDIAEVVRKKGLVDGLIISNTTISRPENLLSKERGETGGLSGKPLYQLSNETIRDMYSLTNGEVPIIGVGGVSSGKDAYKKICAGASLVQLYSSLIYGGPPVIDKVKKELRDCIIADGFNNVYEAVGKDHSKGRKIAVDASMSIYQFLIAVRQESNMLTNSEGETTSHLVGLFYRTIRMIDNGIKPLYVFDGKPPQLKSSELEKRQERREEAQKNLEQAEEEGIAEDVNKYSRRLVKVTRQHNDECKELLRLMGVPYVEAPCEAEAQCAALVKAGKVYATATEDMDGLTFGSDVLLRHMTFSEARKMPIKEFYLNRVLGEMELSQDEFIDLCILLGCDYCESIRGIGPKRAFDLIKTHKSIENIIENIDSKKYPIPDQWMYKEARELFKSPEVTAASTLEIKWIDPDEEGLVKFLCENKGFSEDRVKNGVKKLMKNRHGSTQGRLDSFFTVMPKNNPPVKRKSEENGNDKKKKTPAKGKFKKGK